MDQKSPEGKAPFMEVLIERQNILVERLSVINSRLYGMKSRMNPGEPGVSNITPVDPRSPQGYVGALMESNDKLDSLTDSINLILSDLEKLI